MSFSERLWRASCSFPVPRRDRDEVVAPWQIAYGACLLCFGGLALLLQGAGQLRIGRGLIRMP